MARPTVVIVNVNIAFIIMHQSVNTSAAVAGVLLALLQVYAIATYWIYKQGIFKQLQILFKMQRSVNRSLSESSLLIVLDYRAKTHKLLT